MKKLIFATMCLLSTSAFAGSSLFAEYSAHKGKFSDGISADLNGGAFGISTSQSHNGYWGKFEYLTSSEFNNGEKIIFWNGSKWDYATKKANISYYELAAGGHLNFYNVNNVYLLGTLGVGVGVIDVDGFDSSAYFTMPVGIEAGYNFAQNLSVYGGIGYKWAIEIKDKRTLCKDGTRSDSKGSGTCSWHGGVATGQDSITVGDFDGVTYKVGLRYNF